MKKITGILLIVLFAMTPGFAQQKNIDAVIVALRAGSASELSKYFDDNVELTLPDKSDSYSKAQAQLIIRDFFGNNGVKGFELKHKGDSPGGQFCVGTLQTGTGSFRTNLFMKIKGGKEVVKEIRFQAIE
ncbi:MAG: DUF4783 domain-containing protein [Chitinophagaceae bacterium]